MTITTGDATDATAKMPVLFVGHGNPLNAVEDNAFSRSWKAIAGRLPRPQAILVVSAHWETEGTRITAMADPSTIHDFYGFPQVLYEKNYPAPGDPHLARRIKAGITDPPIQLDSDWGLDHGAWSVLCRMFPAADIPVVQLSLDAALPPDAHYRLGRQLAPLRRQGVLVVGSGNMVHNLGVMTWRDEAFDWALAADEAMKSLIAAGDHPALIAYPKTGMHASLAIPTREHYLPLLYILAMQEGTDSLSFFCEAVTLGSISMRSLLLG